eukprot:scaffold3568_cov16-Tisochrysis_lutea.AAC.3
MGTLDSDELGRCCKGSWEEKKSVSWTPLNPSGLLDSCSTFEKVSRCLFEAGLNAMDKMGPSVTSRGALQRHYATGKPAPPCHGGHKEMRCLG